MSEKLILWFDEISKEDIPLVGGKGANLGELSYIGMPVPSTFCVTANAFRYYLRENELNAYITKEFSELDIKDIKRLNETTGRIRGRIEKGKFPKRLENEIIKGYERLGKICGQENPFCAIRSSATAEDLPDASFAGQHETYLNISGKEGVLNGVKRCMGSLYTPRATVYREKKGFEHEKVYLSTIIQKMVQASAAGVVFTIEPNSGNQNILSIDSSYGLGEAVVGGQIVPDNFFVFKKSCKPVKKKLGRKTIKIVHTESGTKRVNTTEEEVYKFSISDEQIEELSRYCVKIEEHYGKPMDIEWAIEDGKIYILQARPETVYSARGNIERTYYLKEKGRVLAEGIGIGGIIGRGEVNVLRDVSEAHKFKDGGVLVTEKTNPDWLPVMEKSSAIVTEEGGPTCHAAIVSREIGVPCIVGVRNAIKKLGGKD